MDRIFNLLQYYGCGRFREAYLKQEEEKNLKSIIMLFVGFKFKFSLI
jgi:hypothetical protein